MTLVLSFQDPRATDVARAGGKGASLARAAQNLPVPPGLVIISDSYRAFIAPVRAALADILADSSLDHASKSVNIRRVLLNQPLPSALVDELAVTAQEAGLLGGAVAVRSSGTMEDLPGAAFAGQHDTFLGVRGLSAILDSVRRCYASLWNAHVLPYRERMGLNHMDAAMAVVIQRMVEVSATGAAGVAFSIDPVRGDLDHVVINAAFGLGETVVAGESPVDEYRVRRADKRPLPMPLHEEDEGCPTSFAAWSEALDPAEGGMLGEPVMDPNIVIARKPQALVADGAGGTRHVDLPPGQQNEAALGERDRQAVAQLALAAEVHFGFPQDIEWAIEEGRLFLLQSRPITRIPARWTRDESAERFPNPVTPLTWDLCEAGFHASLNHSFKLMGLPTFGDKWFAMKDHYIYGNQNAVQLYSGRTPVKMLKSVDAVRAALPEIAHQFAWVQELPVQWMRDLDVYLIEIGALANEAIHRLNAPSQLWDHVLRINRLGSRYFLPNIAISLTQRLLYVGMQKMLGLALPADQAQQVFDQLMAVTDTKTSQINDELWALSRLARQDARLLTVMQEDTSKAVMTHLPEHPAFEEAFTAFLTCHGHRELDFDAYVPTWVEAPWVVLDQIRLLAARPDEERVSKHAAKVAQADMERLVLNHTPEDLRYLVFEVIRLARAYTALDDLEHYQTTRLTPLLRRGLRALGENLVTQGALVEPMDIFFVPFAVLDEAVRTEDFSSLLNVVAQNKAGYDAARQRTPDWVHGEADDLAVPADGALSGLGGSPGVVEGEVFLVHGPEDFAAFPKDAILVARTTNPAWTPLFYQARGVITESGGPLSHGAVTARELGLPAVMSVRNVLQLLTNGERVRIDGAKGRVQRLSQAS